MSTDVHPQVAALLERIARSPLPPYATVAPFVARRIYRDTRAAVTVHGFLPMGGVLDTASAAVGECSEALRAAFDGVK